MCIRDSLYRCWFRSYLTGFVGMHRIPKTFNAGTIANIGLHFALGGATLVLAPDYETRLSCIGVPSTGDYLLDPAGTGHAFAGRCNVDGNLEIYAETQSFATYQSICGGSSLSPCAPSCYDGCQVIVDGKKVCCNAAPIAESKTNVALRWTDTLGRLIAPEHLNALADYGFDSTGNDVSLWMYDSADGGDYNVSVISYGTAGRTKWYYSDWVERYHENEWSERSDDIAKMANRFVGSGFIPMTMRATTPHNFGVWGFFNNGGAFTLAPPDRLVCDYITGTHRLTIDPTDQGSSFPAVCKDGATLLRHATAGLSVYYTQCGGVADTDCTPSCSDGCLIETMAGYQTEVCCDDNTFLTGKTNTNFQWVSENGDALFDAQLIGLATGRDSSMTNNNLWLIDASDQNGYKLTVSYFNGVSNYVGTTNEYLGLNINAWDRNSDMQTVADWAAPILGNGKIPTKLNGGTQSNWGVYMSLPESFLVLTPSQFTYDSCFDAPYSGVHLIDPKGTGRAFPAMCGGDGTVSLKSKYSGHSVYYSQCGGTVDDDCTPSCTDGCKLEDSDECCDSGAYLHVSAKTSIDFAWVDEIGNTVPSAQLAALAALGYTSSNQTEVDLWVHDATDGSDYVLTISFYGSTTDDAVLTTPASWINGLNENVWDNTNTTTFSAAHGLLLGEDRIPQTMSVGTKQNWGVWVHFKHNRLVLTPS